MADSLVDIVDEKNQPTREQALISEVHASGDWHRVAHIWIYNKEKGMLLQWRAAQKKLFPSRWDIGAAGHVDSGEQPEKAAIRETREEIGLKIKPEDLDFWKIKKMRYREEREGIVNNEFCYAYLLRISGQEDFRLEEKEVTDLKFFSLKDLKKELKKESEKFVPHGEYWWEILEEIKKQLSIAISS